MSLVGAVEAGSRQDRRAIFDYIETRDVRAALEMDKLFSRKANKLATVPQLGKPGRVPGTRELVAHKRYVLVYEVAGNQIQVLRVLHTARKWP